MDVNITPIVLKAGGVGFGSQAELDKLLSELRAVLVQQDELVAQLSAQVPAVVKIPRES